jgi:hypothetical protein
MARKKRRYETVTAELPESVAASLPGVIDDTTRQEDFERFAEAYVVAVANDRARLDPPDRQRVDRSRLVGTPYVRKRIAVQTSGWKNINSRNWYTLSLVLASLREQRGGPVQRAARAGRDPCEHARAVRRHLHFKAQALGGSKQVRMRRKHGC